MVAAALVLAVGIPAHFILGINLVLFLLFYTHLPRLSYTPLHMAV